MNIQLLHVIGYKDMNMHYMQNPFFSHHQVLNVIYFNTKKIYNLKTNINGVSSSPSWTNCVASYNSCYTSNVINIMALKYVSHVLMFFLNVSYLIALRSVTLRARYLGRDKSGFRLFISTLTVPNKN